MSIKEKDIDDPEIIEATIAKAQIIHVSFARNNDPYVLPFSFGFDGKDFFIHTGRDGHKLDYLSYNNNVCFVLESDVALMRNDSYPCKWGFQFV